MKNIWNDLGEYNYHLDKILPNLKLRHSVHNKLLIMHIKWLNLSLSKQPGWSWEIDDTKTDVCVVNFYLILLPHWDLFWFKTSFFLGLKVFMEIKAHIEIKDDLFFFII